MTEEQFVVYLKELNIIPSKIQLEQLEKYYELLLEWNKYMNLTNITEKKEVYLKHFYDSLMIVKSIDLKKQNTLCDIGTGAGFPGIVLKIMYPTLKITLVDSLNKRIKFLNNIIETLKLTEIEVYHSRIETFYEKNKYDIVTSRAVAHLSVLLEYGIPLAKEKGFLIAYKGKVTDEINESKNALKVLNSKIFNIITFKLPIENSERNIICIEKEKHNTLYPRKYNEIKNNRL